MSSQLLTAWPETFMCGGLLNGGIGFHAAKRISEYATADGPKLEELYKMATEAIDSSVANGVLPDQSALENNRVYIFGALNDDIISINM